MQDRTRSNSNSDHRGGEQPLTRSAAVVIAVTFQRLVEDATRFWSVDEQLVLDALRRSATRLNNASVAELADYVASLTPDQLRGVASNVKGIYHELLFVHAENIDSDDVAARIFGATNHPGADVEFLVDGGVIRSVQLKAVASPETVFEHLARYPDIEVIATSEVAELLPGVTGSGFSNTDLTRQVQGVFSELPGDNVAEELAEGMATSALVAGAATAAQILRTGSVSRRQFATAFGDVSVGVVTAATLDVLLIGLG